MGQTTASTLYAPETIDHIAQGRHLLATFAGCSEAILNDERMLRQLVQQAATDTGAAVLDVMSYQFAPQGVTVLAMLAESHASLHTYPEQGVAFWDCFTCGWSSDPHLSIDSLQAALQPLQSRVRCVLRGGEDDEEHIKDLSPH